MDKRTIAVIFGGCSPEYPVSLESSHSVIVNLDREKYDVILLGITKGGEWYRFYGPVEAIEDDSWLSDRSLWQTGGSGPSAARPSHCRSSMIASA